MTQDLTLDEIREAIAPGIAANAAFDGWSDAARDMAAEGAGIDPDVARLAFPGGAVDMIDAWFAHVDRTMAAALPAETLDAMKIRERIAAGWPSPQTWGAGTSASSAPRWRMRRCSAIRRS